MDNWTLGILVVTFVLLIRVAYMVSKAEGENERIMSMFNQILTNQDNMHRDILDKSQLNIDVINARFEAVQSEYKFEMPRLKKELEEMLGEIHKISLNVDELQKVQDRMEIAIDRLD